MQRDTMRHTKDDGIIMCRSHPEQIQITKIVIYIYQQMKQYFLKISLTNKHIHTRTHYISHVVKKLLNLTKHVDLPDNYKYWNYFKNQSIQPS